MRESVNVPRVPAFIEYAQREAAESACPASKALARTTITLDAGLE